MKGIFLLMCSCLLVTIIFSQKTYLTERPVYIDAIKQYIYVFSKKDSSIRTNRGDQDTRYIKVFNLTPKGAMRFILNDTSTHYILKGQYKEATKVSKPKGFTRDGARVITTKGGIAEPYYNPTRDGTWFYYDNKGNLIRKEVYKGGTVIKS